MALFHQKTCPAPATKRPCATRPHPQLQILECSMTTTDMLVVGNDGVRGVVKLLFGFGFCTPQGIGSWWPLALDAIFVHQTCTCPLHFARTPNYQIRPFPAGPLLQNPWEAAPHKAHLRLDQWVWVGGDDFELRGLLELGHCCLGQWHR